MLAREASNVKIERGNQSNPIEVHLNEPLRWNIEHGNQSNPIEINLNEPLEKSLEHEGNNEEVVWVGHCSQSNRAYCICIFFHYYFLSISFINIIIVKLN